MKARRSSTTGAPGQLSFAFGGPPASKPPSSRLFYALLPDDEVRARIAALARQLRSEHGLTAPPIPPERLHVSLHFVGADPQPDVIAAARWVGAAVAAPAFDVTFERVLSLRGSRRLPVVLAGGSRLSALMAFRRLLGEAMEKAGLERISPPAYMPHITLLYDEEPVDDAVTEPVTWTVREFVLIQSLVGQGRHIHIARWALQP